MKARSSWPLVLGWALLLRTSVSGAPPTANSDFSSYLASYHYIQVPLFDQGTNEQAVRATINGQRVRLIVDTGCGHTCLTFDCARRLHLKAVDSGKKASGVGGELTENSSLALIQSFVLGGCEINRTNIVEILPRSASGFNSDGFLGLDFLRLNAGILLVGSKGMILKPGATPVAAIRCYMTNLGFTAIPLAYKGEWVGVAGQVNGKAFRAVVDTGASFSMFDQKLVEAATDHALASLPMHMQGIDGNEVSTYSFVPDSLALGGFDVPPTRLSVATSPTVSKAGMDGLLGFDLMVRHAAIIDLGSSTLWMR